jgi:hypothetical protein
MASHNAVLKLESKLKLRQVSNSAQTQHFSSLELLAGLVYARNGPLQQVYIDLIILNYIKYENIIHK